MTWWQVPRTVKVVLEGELRPGVSGKDVILTLCGLYSAGEVLNAAVEFHGPGVATLSMDDRMTISNMTTEWGALVGWFGWDRLASHFLRGRASMLDALGIHGRLTGEMIDAWDDDPPAPDPDAGYAAEIVLDLARVSPFVAGPHVVSIARPVAEVAKDRMRIHKAYLLSCVNSRVSDLAQAARVLDGQKVADGVELYVAAASARIQEEAEARGDWEILKTAGATMLPPGCGACIGLGVGLLEPGEVGISATNRNFKGRMGSRDAEAYLASPAVVAASAAAGFITGPEDLGASTPEVSFADLGWSPPPREVAIMEGFPERLEGRALLLPADSLNTDGIYGKDVTYLDHLTPDEMARHAMANYDPAFQEIAVDGDIIIAGRNFGTGSSREQAATALKYRGIQAVIAGSFSQTYLRNAFNNAFICLESPALAEAVRAAHAAEAEGGAKTIPAGELAVNFKRAVAMWGGREYQLSPVGPAAQELVLAGGLEALTRTRLTQ
jgi:homoaconitate hydratase